MNGKCVGNKPFLIGYEKGSNLHSYRALELYRLGGRHQFSGRTSAANGDRCSGTGTRSGDVDGQKAYTASGYTEICACLASQPTKLNQPRNAKSGDR